MAKFEVEGRSYNTEDFSDHQKGLVSSLSVTNGLIVEIAFKNDLFLKSKDELDKTLKKALGSKIKEFTGDPTNQYLVLASGKKIKISEIDQKIAQKIAHLSFVNEQINYYTNQLQVLDTAKISYSKNFYESLTGADES